MSSDEVSRQKEWPKEMWESGSLYFELFTYPLLDMKEKETEM